MQGLLLPRQGAPPALCLLAVVLVVVLRSGDGVVALRPQGRDLAASTDLDIGPIALDCPPFGFTRAPAAIITGIYAGWINKQNLGDDLVEDLLLVLLRQAIMDYGNVTADRVAIDWQPKSSSKMKTGCSLTYPEKCHFGVLGGGSTSSPPYLYMIRSLLEANKPVFIAGTGVQDQGKEMTSSAVARLIKSTGHICSDLHQAQDEKRLHGGVRGPLSQQVWLQACNLTMPIVYDSGLLAHLFLSEGGRALQQMHESLRLDPRLPVAVLTFKHDVESPVFDRMKSFSPESVSFHDFKISLMRELAQTHQLVLQPTDPYSLNLHRYLVKAAEGEARGLLRIVANEDLTSYDRIMHLYSSASFSFNERLHPGIMAAAALTPFFYLAHNLKFKDFSQSLAMEDNLLDTKTYMRMSSREGNEKLFSDLMAKVKSLKGPAYKATRASLEQQRAVALQRYNHELRGFVGALWRKSPDTMRAIMCCADKIQIMRQKPTVVRSQEYRQLAIACGWSG